MAILDPDKLHHQRTGAGPTAAQAAAWRDELDELVLAHLNEHHQGETWLAVEAANVLALRKVHGTVMTRFDPELSQLNLSCSLGLFTYQRADDGSWHH